MLYLLRKIMFPFSLVYALVVHFRNFLYDTGVFTSKSYKTPTICVGNLSVGGTGKTPMTEFLIRLLQDKRVAILSRGYRRKSKGFVLATPQSSVLDLGDEPYQMFRKFPKVSIAVDGDRQEGIEQLETLVGPDVILLDDAFQHRRVKPSFSILLTAFNELYRDDWYLPTGNLRDSKKEARRAEVIIVTKCPKDLPRSEQERIREKLKPLPNQKVLFAWLAYAETFSDGAGGILEYDGLSDKKVALVTGIASPEPLVSHLKSQGIVFEHLKFGDHHHFTASEIQQFGSYDIIVTTEKDFVRLHGKVDGVYYLEIAHQFNADDKEMLQEAIANLL